MKKQFLSVSLIAAVHISFAQNVFPTATGSFAGIGTTSPTHALTFFTNSTGISSYNNTTDPTTDYERLVQQYQSNVFTIGTYFGGTGTSSRSIKIGTQTSAGTTTLATSLARVFTVNPFISATAGIFDFNGTISGGGSLVTINTSVNGSTAQNLFSIQGTILQTGGGSYTGLLVAPFESTVGTGNHYLIDAGINSAASGGGSHTPKFTIDDNGNSYTAGTTGINTNYIPFGFQMAVNGSVIATAVTVQLRSSWPDYVFKRSYRLRSLNDLNTYVVQNHHLPEMPSQEQIAKVGLNLGEIDKMLTKKVEELTLYMIEKDKQVIELQKNNQSQQEDIDLLKKQVSILLQLVNQK